MQNTAPNVASEEGQKQSEVSWEEGAQWGKREETSQRRELDRSTWRVSRESRWQSGWKGFAGSKTEGKKPAVYLVTGGNH